MVRMLSQGWTHLRKTRAWKIECWRWKRSNWSKGTPIFYGKWFPERVMKFWWSGKLGEFKGPPGSIYQAMKTVLSLDPLSQCLLLKRKSTEVCLWSSTWTVPETYQLMLPWGCGCETRWWKAWWQGWPGCTWCTASICSSPPTTRSWKKRIGRGTGENICDKCVISCTSYLFWWSSFHCFRAFLLWI